MIGPRVGGVSYQWCIARDRDRINPLSAAKPLNYGAHMTARASRRTVAAVLFAAIAASLGAAAHAATLAPVKPYVKPGEPVEIKFLKETTTTAKKSSPRSDSRRRPLTACSPPRPAARYPDASISTLSTA